MTTDSPKPVVEPAPAVTFNPRATTKERAVAPIPIPLDYAPPVALSLEDQKAMLAEELGPSYTTPDLAPQPKAKQAPSLLKAQFAMFSCPAFMLYLQGVPNIQGLQSLEAINRLTLDEVFTTPGLLTCRSRVGAGRSAMTKPNPFLWNLLNMLATVDGRLDFTSTLYQSTAKTKHMEVIRALTEQADLNLVMGSCMNRKNATAKLDEWKATVARILEEGGYSSIADYHIRTTTKRVKDLTPEELAQAMDDL